jgi:hypothetical protein
MRSDHASLSVEMWPHMKGSEHICFILNRLASNATFSSTSISAGGSALTDDLTVPKNRALEEIDHGIPSTYVPCSHHPGICRGY